MVTQHPVFSFHHSMTQCPAFAWCMQWTSWHTPMHCQADCRRAIAQLFASFCPCQLLSAAVSSFSPLVDIARVNITWLFCMSQQCGMTSPHPACEDCSYVLPIPCVGSATSGQCACEGTLCMQPSPLLIAYKPQTAQVLLIGRLAGIRPDCSAHTTCTSFHHLQVPIPG